MAMEALPSNDFLNFLIYDTLSANPICNNNSFPHFNSSSSSDTAHTLAYTGDHQVDNDVKLPLEVSNDVPVHKGKSLNLGVVQGGGVVGCGKKKRRKRARVCKNKEEAETQRMTHIVVERNRRKQMNEHLSVLRSLMPPSYAQRGDQASIVGGAIEFVKELEHIVQSLEAQKYQMLTQPVDSSHHQGLSDANNNNNNIMAPSTPSSPFSQFFTYPQYIRSQHNPDAIEYTASTKAAIADIEVTLIETHANIRILSKRSPKQPYRIVFSFQAVHLTILHLNITTMDSVVFYSISAKIEEGCPLNSVDDIAGAVHHMLRIIEQEEEEEQKEDADVAVAVASMCVPK